MLSEFLECEANRENKYCRVIKTNKRYSDGRRFPLNEVVKSDMPVNLHAEDKTALGGFCVSTYEYIFRWIIRGDTLCNVVIPEKYKIYKTVSENGIYVADHIILKDPIKIDDNVAMELYKKSKLPEISYFKAMAACAICGYHDTALRVCRDKVNKANVDVAIKEIEDYCTRRKQENFIEENIENVKFLSLLRDMLENIKNNAI